MQADVLCFSETWLDDMQDQSQLEIEDFTLLLNSAGRGKGIATYYKDKTFSHKILQCKHVKKKLMQMTVLSTQDLNIINIYRSKYDNTLKEVLTREIDSKIQTPTLVIGDFNICYKENPNNEVSRTLQERGFVQTVKEATHIEGGHIDHVYFRGGDVTDVCNVNTSLYSAYYTCHDHDCILITVKV